MMSPHVPETDLRPAPRDREPPPAVRADIVAAATRLFGQRGYHATSMTEIAESLGIRKASLYYHVRKKEDLLFAIHEQLIDELIERTLPVFTSSEPPPAKIRAAITTAMSFVAEHRDGVTVFLHEQRAVHDGERWRELVVKRDFYEQMVHRIVADGSAAGAFVDVPPRIAAKAILSMANWATTWYQPSGPLTPDEIGDTFAEIVLRGLETR